MRTRGLRFISRGTRVVGWLQKKKKKSQMNGGRNSSRRVPCLTRQFGRFGSLSRKGLSRKKGVECRVSIDAMEKKKAVLRLVVRGFP